MCLLKLWFSQGMCPVVGLLCHTAVLFLVFKEISILFFIVAVQIYIPTNSVGRFPFLHVLPTRVTAYLLEVNHSGRCAISVCYSLFFGHQLPCILTLTWCSVLYPVSWGQCLLYADVHLLSTSSALLNLHKTPLREGGSISNLL